MKCPRCNNKSKVTSSKQLVYEDKRRRRRKCASCGHRWTTYEHGRSGVEEIENEETNEDEKCANNSLCDESELIMRATMTHWFPWEQMPWEDNDE